MKRLATLLCLFGATGAMAQAQSNAHHSFFKKQQNTAQEHLSLHTLRIPANNIETANKTLGMKHTLDSAIIKTDFGVWVNNQKETYRYNSTGALVNGSFSEWSANATHWETMDSISIPNPAPLLPGYINYSLNQNSNLWEIYSKGILSYNSNGKTTLSIDSTYSTSSSQYSPDYKTDYVYNTANQLTQSTDYSWDGTTWVNSSRTNYTYSNGKITVLEYKLWDNSNNVFVSVEKINFTYSGTTAATGIAAYWDLNTNAWTNYSKTEYTFDSNGNPTSETTSSANGSQWDLDEKSVFTYDLTTSLSDVIVPIKEIFEPFFLNNITNKPLTYKTYSYESLTAQWENEDSTTYYYTTKNLAVNDKITKLTTAIYPNPATDVISFEIANSQPATARIYNAAGQIVMAQQVRSKDPIAVSNLPKGMYIYTLTQGNATESGKLVLE